MIEVRKLSINDRALIAEALAWINDFPRWIKDADKAWGHVTVDDYIAMLACDPQADFAVFDDGEMVAEISISLFSKECYNSHLMMKRGARKEAVMVAAASLIETLRERGCRGYSWVLARNHGLREIVELIGMQRDGLEQYKGQTHGHPLLWLRYTV